MHLKPATVEEAEHIALHMRRPDVLEVLASHGHTPREAILASLECSTFAGTVMDGDEPVGMYGVAPHVPQVGSPWFLSTAAIHRPHVRRFFLRNTRPVIERMLRQYPILIQHVDARHTDSVKWMLFGGFQIDKFEPQWGVEKIPFFRFSKVAHV